MGLSHAHKGYEYQDLLVAVTLVDVQLDNTLIAQVDCKLHDGDVFDDLTWASTKERRRFQFKHSNSATPAELSLFTTNTRDLRLDRVISSMLLDRAVTGGKPTSYRIVLRAALPTDVGLSDLLGKPAASPETVAVFGGTVRCFSADAVCPVDAESSLACLRESQLSKDDVRWACKHLLVEFESAEASFDLLAPGAAERLLLLRVQNELGAGCFPNEARNPIDVARALVGFARSARQGTVTPTTNELARALQLRRDFGSVARAHPVTHQLEVPRRSATADLVAAIEGGAADGKAILVTGPPGHGKSWLAHQAHRQLRDAGWVVAEHYCYLSEIDDHRSQRVHAQRILGSLLARLEEEDAAAVSRIRPRFAANAETLVAAVESILAEDPGRRVALIVDGLDHVDRVNADRVRERYTSEEIAAELASIELPVGSTIIILSQRGAFLERFRAAGCSEIETPQLSLRELEALAEKFLTRAHEPLFAEIWAEFVDALAQRAHGNALYATYVCRQLAANGTTLPDLVAALDEIPPFDEQLHGYYTYLVSAHDDALAIVAENLALVDFAVSRAELASLASWFPRARLDAAIDRLSPVLAEVGAQGGIRVYHESFKRFLLKTIAESPDGSARMNEALSRVATWLEQRGFISDARSYRFLLPTLLRLNANARIVELITRDFAVESIGAGWMPHAICSNLAVGVEAGVRLEQWPFVVRCIELARAASTFEEERLEGEWLEYADVALDLDSHDQLVSGLLFEGRCTVPARVGLSLCALIDKRGGTPPWKEYLDALDRDESSGDNSGDSSEVATLAIANAHLRLAAEPPGAQALAEWAESVDAEQAVELILRTRGREAALDAENCVTSGQFALALAEHLDPTDRGDLVLRAQRKGLQTGSLHRLSRLGGAPATPSKAEIEAALFRATISISTSRIAPPRMQVLSWLDLGHHAALQDPLILRAASALVDGPGWFKDWLRFCLIVVELDASPGSTPRALSALELLQTEQNPFVGTPRACDLYELTRTIHDTLDRVLRLVSDDDWERALAVLRTISEQTTTSMRGAPSGPLTTESLLALVVAHTTATRAAVTQAFLDNLLSAPAGHRYFSELAAYRLTAARLALRIGDEAAARRLWKDACRLLLAYGFRKDTTLWELLDPIPELGRVDAAVAARCLQEVLPLCQRVTRRTDGKETRHAIPEWWRLAARLDPQGTVEFATTEYLASPNEWHEVLDEALNEVWRKHAEHADPIVGGVFRYASSMTLEDNDRQALSRLSELRQHTQSKQGQIGHLMELILARVDERSKEQAATNGNKYRAEDNLLIASLNEASTAFRLPRVALIPLAENERDLLAGENQTITDLLGNRIVDEFPRGRRGIRAAVRAWTSQPLRATTRTWEVDRFINLVGYRLLEMIDQNDEVGAMNALLAIGPAIRFGGAEELLSGLGDGLAAAGNSRMAAAAHTMAWTTTRGGGGWLSFGGKQTLGALELAAAEDATTMHDVLASTISDIVAEGNYRTFGLSRALIVGLARTKGNVAFDAWAECFAVIAARLPLLPGDVDKSNSYVATAPCDREKLDANLATATVATLAHAAWERKRRALVAVELVCSFQPELAGAAIARVLRNLTDPASLTWLLAMVIFSENAKTVAKRCCAELDSLSRTEHLTVRALARRLLTVGDIDVAPPPVYPADSPLTSNISSTVPRHESFATRAVDRNCGMRLDWAEELVPGLREATVRRLEVVVASEEFREAQSRRVRDLCGVEPKWLPEASLPIDEAAETALQLAASGARTALAAKGMLSTTASSIEDRLAGRLLADPRLLVRLEACRINRPEFRFPPSVPGAGSLDPSTKVDLPQPRTERILPPREIPVLTGGGLQSWRVVAYTESETQRLGRFSSAEEIVVSRIDASIEIDGAESLTSPFGEGGGTVWLGMSPDLSAPNEHTLVLRDDQLTRVVALGGVGSFCPLLQPTRDVVERLRLRLVDPLVLQDEVGPAVTLRTWRSEYTEGTYSLPFAARRGVAMLVRPDCFETILSLFAKPICWREFSTFTKME